MCACAMSECVYLILRGDKKLEADKSLLNIYIYINII
jgi:hypothetical protein